MMGVDLSVLCVCWVAVMVANNGAHGMRAYSWGKRR